MFLPLNILLLFALSPGASESRGRGSRLIDQLIEPLSRRMGRNSLHDAEIQF